MIKAGPFRCEETSMFASPLPCNAPAVSMVKNRDPQTYRMCAACAEHNVRNRGASIVAPFEPTFEYAGFLYVLLIDGEGRATNAEPAPGQHKAANKMVHKSAAVSIYNSENIYAGAQRKTASLRA